MSSERPPFRLSSLIVPVFIPSALFSTGEYALVPMIPASAERLGASLPLAGIIAGFVMIGTVLADIPAARVVDRFGERRSMLYSALVAAFGLVMAVVSQNIWLLAAGVMIVGFSAAVFALARHAFMAENVPLEMRARAVSMLGGMFRLGSFAGPMLSAAVIAVFDVQAVFWLSAVAMLGSVAVLLASKEAAGSAHVSTATEGTFKILWRERSKLLTVGMGASILGMLRTTRIIGLPLWALALKLPPEQTALYIGIASALDFALFYTSGQILSLIHI